MAVSPEASLNPVLVSFIVCSCSGVGLSGSVEDELVAFAGVEVLEGAWFVALAVAFGDEEFADGAVAFVELLVFGVFLVELMLRVGEVLFDDGGVPEV